jgi:hypothetical protein
VLNQYAGSPLRVTYLDESDPEQVIQFSIARDAAWLLVIRGRSEAFGLQCCAHGSFYSSTHLIVTLIIAANADFPFVMTRNKDEIGRREDERNRPPDGSEEKTVWAGGDSVSRQRILRR